MPQISNHGVKICYKVEGDDLLMRSDLAIPISANWHLNTAGNLLINHMLLARGTLV